MRHLLYFGEVAEQVGRNEDTIMLPEPTLAALVHYLTTQYQLDFSRLKIAINQELVDPQKDQALGTDDEIAILSQFAGG